VGSEGPKVDYGDDDDDVGENDDDDDDDDEVLDSSMLTLLQLQAINCNHKVIIIFADSSITNYYIGHRKFSFLYSSQIYPVFVAHCIYFRVNTVFAHVYSSFSLQCSKPKF